MSADHLTRRERLAAEAAEERLEAVVVAPSPDLIYLTGYGPMPLPRLTAAGDPARTATPSWSCRSSSGSSPSTPSPHRRSSRSR